MPHPADDNSIGLYLFRYEIDGSSYCGSIPARSYDDAAEKVKSFGAIVDGRAVETHSVNLCAICRGDIVTDETTQLPSLTEEWPDEL